uniref:Uncharacterized protein n=1 Tax=Tetranychus urticae TaxID=32264 RepID=T1KGH9_TETUR
MTDGRYLVGDAYDLAFLSRQLAPDLITRLQFREQKRFIQTETQECNETLVHIAVNGNFRKGCGWHSLSLEQIVKILIYFSKVIPLAATASYDEVNLIFNSRYEAHTASRFINKLTIYEVPYSEEFNGTSEVQQEQQIFASFSIESTSDIDVLDGEAAKKLQYLFTITIDSDFKFTSGVISIIKMHLVSMDCPACIEFEDVIWVGVDALEKGNKAKARIEQIKFKLLHEKDNDDFEAGVTMQLALE